MAPPGRRRRSPEPKRMRRLVEMEVDSAATIPEDLSAPVTTSTACVVILTAYPMQTNTPPMTPAHLYSGKRHTSQRWRAGEGNG